MVRSVLEASNGTLVIVSTEEVPVKWYIGGNTALPYYRTNALPYWQSVFRMEYLVLA